MKNLLVVSLIALSIFSLHTRVASARDVEAYHIGTYRINPQRTERTKCRRRRIENSIYVMSLQLGANQTSLRNLSVHMPRYKHHRLVQLDRYLRREFIFINHRPFVAKDFYLAK